MAKKTKHNPERKAFKGRSYKKGGTRIKKLKEAYVLQATVDEDVIEEAEVFLSPRAAGKKLMSYIDGLGIDVLDDASVSVPEDELLAWDGKDPIFVADEGRVIYKLYSVTIDSTK
jgi:hypothetical protein